MSYGKRFTAADVAEQYIQGQEDIPQYSGYICVGIMGRSSSQGGSVDGLLSAITSDGTKIGFGTHPRSEVWIEFYADLLYLKTANKESS